MTDRQRRFVACCRDGCGAAEAAARAGYSPGRAKRQAKELLRRPEIAQALAAAEAEQARAAEAEAREAAGVSQARIMRELARIAFDNEAVRDGDRLRALEMLTKLLPSDGGDDAPPCGVVILPEVMAAEETRSREKE